MQFLHSDAMYLHYISTYRCNNTFLGMQIIEDYENKDRIKVQTKNEVAT